MQLSSAPQTVFEFGFAHSSEISGNLKADVGPAGVGLLFFQTASSKFSLVVVDANNSLVGFRETVMKGFHEKTSEDLLELTTSDTHVTAAKVRNARGYLALGDLTTPEEFTGVLCTLLEKAKTRLATGSFETSISTSSVRTIGSQVLDNFSGLLDESTLIAKRGAEVLGLLAVVLALAVAVL
jgi:predicted neutral ceramidase superfamily lipid hydrolase